MQRSKLVLATIAGVGILGISAVLVPIAISADTTDSNISIFVQKLASKLGMNEDVVQNAVTSVKDEFRLERQSERKAQIETAVSEGKITQRQADILISIMELNLERPNRGNLEELRSLSPEERQSRQDEFRAQREQEVVDALNATGINVTREELESAKTAAKDAGIIGRPEMGIRKGFRGMM